MERTMYEREQIADAAERREQAAFEARLLRALRSGDPALLAALHAAVEAAHSADAVRVGEARR